ncbi:MAG: S41 family peptidase [Pyrinomonadaceae bacterium]
MTFTFIGPAFISAQQPAAPRAGAQDPPPNVAASRNASRRPVRERSAIDATGSIERDFAEALTLVQDNYVDGGKLDYGTIFKSSIIGMLRSLDPHSNFYDRKEFEELRTDQRSEYFGIGASIGSRRTGEQFDTYILATFPNSPAALANLRYGDRIVEVDGQSMRSRTSDEVRDRIRGPRGSQVDVLVERAATGQTEKVLITRAAVPQPSVPEAYLVRPGVGYVAMSRGFNYSTADELQQALDKLRAQGMTSLVLDLRNNPGGFLDQAIRVADKFLQRGQLILTQKGRLRSSDRPYRSENAEPDTTPMVILVNRSTASASEIVAGAMQDHDRALIIGEPSFGKGLVQSIIPLEYGSGLTLTSAKYYTPSGRLIQRDYANTGLYDYMIRGYNRLGEEEKVEDKQKPAGEETRTDTGRVVYGGGGITPDETVKSRLFNPLVEGRLVDPIFGFTRELVNGRIAGFNQYLVQRPIEFNHNLEQSDFPVTEELLKAFKAYLAKTPAFKSFASQMDRYNEFASRQLRFEIITAAYGTDTAVRVLNFDDPQIVRAVESMPRAKQLSMAAMRGRNPLQKSFE